MSDPPHAAEHVLIVEDDPATRSGLTELVRAWGFTAEAAGDGAEALEKVTAFRPSIIVTDLVMPRMSGIELLKALQQSAQAWQDANSPEVDTSQGEPTTSEATDGATTTDDAPAGDSSQNPPPEDPQK